jgi:succinate dehydrogenase / fumarate reductase membrane anchor subunit
MRTVTPIGRVRGLGSAHSGAHHWWVERLTSVSTLLLFLWFIVSLLRLPSLDHGSVVNWLRQPLAAVPMLLLIVSTFWHSWLGLQVIADDYVHEASRFGIVVANGFLNIAGAALAIFAVLKIAFGPGAI